MTRAIRFAQYLGRVDEETVLRQNRLIEALGMDVSWPDGLTPEKTVQIMLHDKKTANGHINFVLPNRIGSGELVSGVTEQQIIEFLMLGNRE